MTEIGGPQHRERDSASLLVMGGFFMLVAIFVAMGPWWVPGFTFPQIVNIVAAAVLFLIGLSMYEVGRRWRRAPKQPDGPRTK